MSCSSTTSTSIGDIDVVTPPHALVDGLLLALRNSFGFGGYNSVAAFRRYN